METTETEFNGTSLAPSTGVQAPPFTCAMVWVPLIGIIAMLSKDPDDPYQRNDHPC